VLDLSDNVAGAYASKLFAMAGADVVVVEGSHGSPLRQAPPLIRTPVAGAPPESAAFAYLHAYKRGIGLDLATPEGARVLDRLADGANLVISSFDGEPGVVTDRDARLRGPRSQLTHLVVSAYGLSGPYRRFVSSSLTDWAAGGYLAITGTPDREPLQGGGPWCGYAAGLTAAIGALSAMTGARQSGTGRLVDLGAMEAMAAAHQWSIVLFTHQGYVKQRGGNRHMESHHPMGLQAVRDGWIVLGAATQAQYEAMCIAMDVPEMIVDERFLTGGHRIDHGDEFDALIAPWLQERTREQVVAEMQAARVPCGKVLALDETLVDAQLEARALWVTPEHFGIDAMMPGVPFAIGAEKPEFREAPAYGADTRGVLREAGLTEAEIDALVASAIVMEIAEAPSDGGCVMDLGAEMEW
jgi:crotonobetainyl-CoA:carnitine CoA-transferase CaiB-like acyl-CoA transferase